MESDNLDYANKQLYHLNLVGENTNLNEVLKLGFKMLFFALLYVVDAIRDMRE